MSKLALLALSAIALGACQKANQNPPVTAASQRVGVMPSNTVISYDSTADTVTVSIAGVDQVLAHTPGFDSKGFKVFKNAAFVVGYQETASGAGYATWIGSISGTGASGVEFGRTSNTTMPTSGSASYTGGYMGILSLTSVMAAQAGVSGDVTILANFDSGMVNGVINNRSIEGGATASDVTLAATAISSGAFSGTTTGGAVTTLGSTATSGSYNGMFTGAAGGEMVGSVSLNHTISGADYIEIGAFVAAK